MSSQRPVWDSVRAAFVSHVRHYIERGGGENAFVTLRAEQGVTLQYAGRVVYELFQNALDRAERRVAIRFDGRTLIVGNDGRALSVDPEFDYSAPRQGEERSDFNALCALHTSNKSPERQFGNKGIGFRSVFGVSDRGTVWSRCGDGGWWGLELSSPAIPGHWRDSAIPELDDEVRALGAEPRPSFQLPRPLRSSDDPHPEAEGLETLVVVQILDDGDAAQIAHEVARLRETRFQFVGLRRPGLDIEIGGATFASTSGWELVARGSLPDLATLASKASHAVKEPTFAVAWAPERSSLEMDGSGGGQALEGRFYNYLPTRMSTGLPIDVHGDFQVKADRDAMSLDADNPVGRFNEALLARAAAAHAAALEAAIASPRCRSDFWVLAGRPVGDGGPWDASLQRELFPEGSLERWLGFAERFFAKCWPISAHCDFWVSSRAWLEGLARYGYWTQAWKKWARRLCDELAARAVPVVPVSIEDGWVAVPLPSRQERGRAAQRRLFYRPLEGTDERLADLRMPAPLLAQGRAVTSFDLGPFEGVSGVSRYSANELLRDLRQVPNDPARQDLGRQLSPDDQASLLRFAYRLRPEATVRHFAWRAFAEVEEAQRVGRAVSTLYLLTTAGRWEPARQLTLDAVDRSWLADVVGLAEDHEGFLQWLGVAPAGAVPLVEGGDAGVVAAVAAPPELQAPGTDEISPLLPRFTPLPTMSAVSRSLAQLPSDCDRSTVREVVAATPWLPAAMFRKQPAGIAPLPSHCAPHDVLLALSDPRSVFFAVPADPLDIEPLRALGAMDQLDGEKASARAAALIEGLRGRCEDPAALSASLAARLVALVDGLMHAMPIEGERIPVLLEQTGRLRWRRGDEDAWLARREERQELRRFFTDLPLVAGTHRKGLAERLGVGEVRLEKRVVGSEPPHETPLARDLRARIEPALSALCAVAEQSRLARVDVERVRRAWFRQVPVLQVGDAWVELSLRGPERPIKPWRKGKFDDVFHLGSPDDAEPGVILFDADPRGVGGPPLRHFGEPLALLLVRNAALGPSFTEILAAVEDEALRDLLERRHLDELAAEWDRELRPLGPGEHERLLEHVGVVCVDPTRVVHCARIGAADVRPGLGIRTGHEVREFLHLDIETQLLDYLPVVIIASEHEQCWRDWCGTWWSRLEAWLMQRMFSPPETWPDDLEAFARGAFDEIDFDPACLVRAWLSRAGLQVEDLTAELTSRAVKFAPVSTPPEHPDRARWKPGHGSHGSAFGGPERKMELADIVDENLAKAAWGDAAERALLSWVVEQTAALLGVPGAEEALLSALPPRSHTRETVITHLRAGDLAAALHVAQFWSGAGYDILGLTDAPDGPRPVRFECKGLPVEARLVRVFLSRRELAVARHVHRHGPGDWRLVGVEPSGHSIDLTPLVLDLIDEATALLAPLHARGIEPDGFRLIVARDGGASG